MPVKPRSSLDVQQGASELQVETAESLRKVLGSAFLYSRYVTWKTDARGIAVLDKDGMKTPINSTICRTCITRKMFDLYSRVIFPAVMPSTPHLFYDDDVEVCREEKVRRIGDYKKSAFAFQLIFGHLYGWANMTVYLHIIAVHSWEFLDRFGSIGLWSQSAFESSHKIFRQQIQMTSHYGGRPASGGQAPAANPESQTQDNDDPEILFALILYCFFHVCCGRNTFVFRLFPSL